MIELSNWQLALAAAALLVCLVLGGWLSRQRGIEDEPASSVSEAPSTDHSELSQLRQQLEDAQKEAELTLIQTHQVQEELEHYFLESRNLQQKLDEVQTILNQQEQSMVEATDLRQQLTIRASELSEAREETELTLLQLHQVQEELEHYFLESRKLQQELDEVQTARQEQLQRIKARLIGLYKTTPVPRHRRTNVPSGDQLEALVQRQQNALRRFKHLRANPHIPE